MSSARPGSATRSASFPPTRTRCRRPAKPNVFALGDATDLPTSKAGSVTHFEAELLDREHRPPTSAATSSKASFDGHANCFIETGFHKALLIDFNYDTEPLPGHFPTAFGLPLLRESRLNHLGKLLFQWVYWHALLPGREIPGIGPDDADSRQEAHPSMPEQGDEHDHDPDRRMPRSTSTPRAS